MSRRAVMPRQGRVSFAQKRNVSKASMYSESPIVRHWSRVGAAGEEPESASVQSCRSEEAPRVALTPTSASFIVSPEWDVNGVYGVRPAYESTDLYVYYVSDVDLQIRISSITIVEGPAANVPTEWVDAPAYVIDYENNPNGLGSVVFNPFGVGDCLYSGWTVEWNVSNAPSYMCSTWVD